MQNYKKEEIDQSGDGQIERNEMITELTSRLRISSISWA
jgi:hypothetical protein